MKYAPVLFILLFLFAPVAVLGQAPAPPHPQSPLEQTLIAAERSFIAAAKTGDVAFFQPTLTDDFSFTDVDGQLSDRQDRIDDLADGGTDLLPYDMKVLPVGEAVAIVTYDVIVRVRPSADQGPPPRYQHFTTVWVKQADAWKMKFQQMTASHWGDW